MIYSNKNSKNSFLIQNMYKYVTQHLITKKKDCLNILINKDATYI